MLAIRDPRTAVAIPSNLPLLLSISVWHVDAGDAVASPTLENWPLFGQKF